jgi:hypothetical protein
MITDLIAASFQTAQKRIHVVKHIGSFCGAVRFHLNGPLEEPYLSSFLHNLSCLDKGAFKRLTGSLRN